MGDFEILGWIGFGFISLGYYLNSQKNLACFYVWAIGNITFILYAYQIESYPMLFMSLFTLAMNIYGYIQWK